MAFDFDGSGQYLVGAASITDGSSAFTLAIHVRPASFAANYVGIGISGVDANNFVYLGVSSSSKGLFAFSSSGAGFTSVESSVTLVADTWAHVCAVQTSTSSRAVFVNGADKQTSATSVGPDLSSGGATYVGVISAGGLTGLFPGDLAEGAMWSVALTDAEVAGLGKGLSPLLVRPQSLIAYWPILGRSVTTEPDRWKNAVALGITGSPTAAPHPRIYLPVGAP